MIYTIGHSTRDISTFLDLLHKYDIELIVDIRTFPGSRMFPHFNQEIMRDWLKDDRLEYIHLPLLGGRRKEYQVDKATVDGWRHKAFRNYATYMQTTDFATGLEQLVNLASVHRTAYMCSEALWWKCHRRMVSDSLVLIGCEVAHIMDNGLQSHKLTEYVQWSNGKIIYPKSKIGDINEKEEVTNQDQVYVQS